ncbi:MAG: alpha/beta hydrolase [Pseudomonadota bacterium]
MPVLRLNATAEGLHPHRSRSCPHTMLKNAARGAGPIIVMVHGFKYLPGDPAHCPHQSIFAQTQAHATTWLPHLGFGSGSAQDGLALAFGWDARGLLWDVHTQARHAGRALGRTIGDLKSAAPHRPLHIITHSMGSEVALEALRHLPAHSVDRVVTLTAASYQGAAEAALAAPAGRTCELINVVSRENDVFDVMYEMLITPDRRGDRAMGSGLSAPNAVTIQIDCPQTLRALTRFSGPIAAPSRRICHWSAYTRPGLLGFYNALLRTPSRVPLSALPRANSRRFSRLFAVPRVTSHLPGAMKGAS